ncbi:PREDICTED: WNT1-inducible-signaling pathway protein 1 [Ceratotherium simum simum]|uniref:WNT1-inducible-signaling pathway protein 1 n=1 Tax=Ceratotherium simum simum TaxID=73337 RepID=A0ABM1CV50_CERSS|nr:PREDICTED: WNT1-inducible-signaling pathway protein 1 [Ceratotherium simum simum]
MRWFLPWTLAVVTAAAAGSTLATALSPAPPAMAFTPEPLEDTYSRPQFCKWPCECPPNPPRCPLGVSLITDGCECCKMCAQQLGDNCTEAAICDPHRGLYCDYSGDRPRYAIGVCAQVVGVGCVLDGVRYNNGQSFQPNCKYNCTCVDGAVGCTPLCLRARPPRLWCGRARRVSVPGRCCDQWVCDDDARRPRKTAPRHTGAFAATGEVEPWHRNCIAFTSPWSPCSTTCGLGVSTRISNVNARCWPEQESRLCNLRPCDVDLRPHIKEGKRCLAVYQTEVPENFTLAGCSSTRSYRPKYCGVCMDDRCCVPYKSKTIDVSFQCPDGPDFSRQVLWIHACFCNLSCSNPNDIFADLESYPDFPEIAD